MPTTVRREPPALTEQQHSLAPQTGRSDQENSAYFSVEILTRQAHKVAADLSVSVSPSRVSRMVRRFVREGRGDIDFRSWVINYMDPTGEQATERVMKERGW